MNHEKKREREQEREKKCVWERKREGERGMIQSISQNIFPFLEFLKKFEFGSLIFHETCEVLTKIYLNCNFDISSGEVGNLFY